MENKGIPGYLVILFTRAMVLHSAGASTPRPHSFGVDTAAFRNPQLLGSTGMIELSELPTHGPRARCPTHMPTRHGDDTKGSLPACRAQLWPGGISHPLDD